MRIFPLHRTCKILECIEAKRLKLNHKNRVTMREWYAYRVEVSEAVLGWRYVQVVM